MKRNRHRGSFIFSGNKFYWETQFIISNHFTRRTCIPRRDCACKHHQHANLLTLIKCLLPPSLWCNSEEQAHSLVTVCTFYSSQPGAPGELESMPFLLCTLSTDVWCTVVTEGVHTIWRRIPWEEAVQDQKKIFLSKIRNIISIRTMCYLQNILNNERN